MADFIGTTVTEVPPKVKNEPALREYLQSWQLGNGNYGGITADIEDEHLYIYGYEYFDVFPIDDGDIEIENEATERFADGLRRYIAAGSAMVIIMIGHEKCRYASASKLTITPKAVEWLSL